MYDGAGDKREKRKIKAKGVYCAAVNCRNNSGSNPDLNFYHFPSDNVRCREWLQNSRRLDLMNRSTTYLSKNIYMCSTHFEPQFLPRFKNQRCRLPANAKPTIFDVPDPPPAIGTKRPLPTRKTQPVKKCKFAPQKTTVEVSDGHSLGITKDCTQSPAQILNEGEGARRDRRHSEETHQSSVKMTRGTQCCAFGCSKRKANKDSTRSDSEGSDDEESALKRRHPRTFHSFPGDPTLRNIWLEKIHRPDWSPSVHARVCSDHFSEVHVNRTGQNVQLRPGAVPTRIKRYPDHAGKTQSSGKLPYSKPGESWSDIVTASSILDDNEKNSMPLAPPVSQATSPESSESAPPESSHSAPSETPQCLLPQQTQSPQQHSSQPLTTPISQSETLNVSLKLRARKLQKAPSLPSELENDHLYFLKDSPQELKAKLDKSNEKIIVLQKKLKASQQQTRRLKQRVKSLKEIVKLIRVNRGNFFVVA